MEEGEQEGPQFLLDLQEGVGGFGDLEQDVLHGRESLLIGFIPFASSAPLEMTFPLAQMSPRL